jgi:ubiquinone/menaquinone biosynthesis C-methylase UbiE
MLSFAGTVTLNYDQYLGPMNFEPFAVDLASRVKKNTQNILEIACGTGRLTRQLRKALPLPIQITATDLSTDMLDFAQSKIMDSGINFLQANAQELPFDNNSFDVIVCQFGYMFATDKPKAFSEAFRVLKKNGLILFNTWDKLENNKIRVTMRKILDKFFKQEMDFLDVPFSMCNPEETSELLRNAGFSNIEYSLVTLEGISPTALDAAKGLIKGNPIYKEILAKDKNAPEKLIAIAEKEIARLYGNYPTKCELNAWVTAAIK